MAADQAHLIDAVREASTSVFCAWSKPQTWDISQSGRRQQLVSRIGGLGHTWWEAVRAARSRCSDSFPLCRARALVVTKEMHT